MPKDKDPGIPKTKKEGWKDCTKALKTIIVKDPKFDGIVFMLGQVPLHKIGIEKSGVVLSGMPTHTVVNASHVAAPPYRIIITEKGYKLYTPFSPIRNCLLCWGY